MGKGLPWWICHVYPLTVHFQQWFLTCWGNHEIPGAGGLEFGMGLAGWHDAVLRVKSWLKNSCQLKSESLLSFLLQLSCESSFFGGLQWVFPTSRTCSSLIKCCTHLALGLVTWMTKDLWEYRGKFFSEGKIKKGNTSCAVCFHGTCIFLLPGKVSCVKVHQGNLYFAVRSSRAALHRVTWFHFRNFSWSEFYLCQYFLEGAQQGWSVVLHLSNSIILYADSCMCIGVLICLKNT